MTTYKAIFSLSVSGVSWSLLSVHTLTHFLLFFSSLSFRSKRSGEQDTHTHIHTEAYTGQYSFVPPVHTDVDIPGGFPIYDRHCIRHAGLFVRAPKFMHSTRWIFKQDWLFARLEVGEYNEHD